MRESEWLRSDSPVRMPNRHQGVSRFDERKLRLFAAACCRRVWDILVDERSREALEALERFVEGRETPARLADYLQAAIVAETQFHWNPDEDGYLPSGKGERWCASNAVLFAASDLDGGKDFFERFFRDQDRLCGLVGDHGPSLPARGSAQRFRDPGLPLDARRTTPRIRPRPTSSAKSSATRSDRSPSILPGDRPTSWAWPVRSTRGATSTPCRSSAMPWKKRDATGLKS